MTKFVFVTGGVVSSLGKGIASASLAALLESRGLKVTLIKLDPYINVDPGTMSPIQHGEVFVTDDGAETDLDLGHYERFITTRTYAERGDGEQYFTTSPTMADPSDVAHAFVFYNDVLMEAARIAAEAAFVLIEKPAEGIAAAESAQVPKGAIYASDAAKIENLVGGAVDAFLFRPKSDNLPSASPLAEGESTITVLRNYNYIGTRELRMEMTVRPLGYNSSITLGVTLDLS